LRWSPALVSAENWISQRRKSSQVHPRFCPVRRAVNHPRSLAFTLIQLFQWNLLSGSLVLAKGAQHAAAFNFT